MSYKLLIVESPAKVKSIGRYLDLESEYKIASSKGHIRDLPKKGGLNVDIKNNFEPNYQIQPDKKKLVTQLKSLAQKAETVIMASDEDREGEAIAWHLCHALKLDPQKTPRIVFHEITETALKKALDSPRTINQNLVNAQQARRILDRIVGFQLSPILWKKIQRGLSAGRVQSVAVRLIYEKEAEIKAFQPQISCRATATFTINNQTLVANLDNSLRDLDEGRRLLESLRQADFKITAIESKPSLKSPSPPFKTSTLQQLASQKMGFSLKKTMHLAQILYEAGFITYMRTDSLNLSQQALKQAGDHIIQTFGENYHQLRNYQTKTKSAQEAHEAIRPTNFKVKKPQKLEAAAVKLYELIHSRTLASQMADAQFDKTTISLAAYVNQEALKINNQLLIFKLRGQVLQFDGFLKVLPESNKDVILPNCQINQVVNLLEAGVAQKFSNPPARFSEASLVKKLEDLGIGRPSTYAPTIDTILERGYVVKGDVEPQIKYSKNILLQEQRLREYDLEEKWGGATNRLLPTSLAELVIPFLKQHFTEIMDYDFTSKIEADFDQIAIGKLDWQTQLQIFYKNFQPLIKAADDLSRQTIFKMRPLGKDPLDQKIIYARLGTYGAMLQKGESQTDSKPVFASLPPNTTLDNVTLEAALEMFKLPKVLGQTADKQTVLVKNGPYGPYLEVEQLRVSLKEIDPLSISLDQALELIEEKKEAELKKIVVDFGSIKIINGPYGPYVTDGKKNARIPKEEQTNDLNKTSQATAKKWLEAKKQSPKRKKRAKANKKKSAK